MDSPFMETIAAGLARRRAAPGVRIVRFEFPYMRARRTEGKRGAPDRPAVLLDSWRALIAQLGKPDRLVIGGKSLGGRIASMIADEADVAGLVCLGYPFHPPGKPDRLRVDHLAALRTPTLILQGERDSLGRREEVVGYTLSQAIAVEWLPDGDHSFKPRKASGRTEAQNLARAAAAIREFIESLS